MTNSKIEFYPKEIQVYLRKYYNIELDNSYLDFIYHKKLQIIFYFQSSSSKLALNYLILYYFHFYPDMLYPP